jgi:transcriptional regulator with XRE-family HTH domain
MPITQPPRVGDNVRAELARARITQQQLASKLGLTQQAVSAKLHGRSEFSVSQLQAAADLIGIPAAALLGESAGAA